MIKKIFTSSLVATMLLLNGCGESEGEERLGTQQDLDNGNYAGVISRLETKSSKTDEDYIALGAAYMGKAGVSLTEIISAMASEDDEENNNDKEDDFATFVEKIAGISNPTAIVDLGKSSEYYRDSLGDSSCSSESYLSDSAKDICLFIGLGATTRAAVTIDSLVGDISKFTDEDEVDNKLVASTCAMQYAFDGGDDSGISSKCSITPDGVVTFLVLEKTYDKFSVIVNGNNSDPYYYLMTDIDGVTNKQTILTQGYCSADSFSPRYEDYNPSLYACPINENPDADDLTSAGVLVEIFNDGLDSIDAVATEDIEADIDEYKCEILGGNYDEGIKQCNDDDSSIINLDDAITVNDIIEFLNEQNEGN